MRYLFLRIALLVVVIGTLIGMAGTAQAVTRQRCFNIQGTPDYDPNITYCIQGPIRQYWERNGGLAVFGYPIRPQGEDSVEGTWRGQVQWFQRDRLEDHSPDGQGVLAGRLGARYLELQGHAWQTFPTVGSAPAGCDYFAQTGHSMCEPFRSFWLTRGGLIRFGFPITQPFSEQLDDGQTYLVQYFERRRMESHPKETDPNYKVLLGLLGVAVCEEKCQETCPRTGCR